MAQFELTMPKMGESVAEATIIKWTKNIGDKVALDETILEIATDKVDSEIPSPFEGTIVSQLFKEGDVVQVGAVIAVLSSDAAVSVSETPKPTPVIEKKEVVEVIATNGADHGDFKNTNRFYSPLVKNIAKQEGISIQELEKLEGSGAGGRLTKSDILSYIPNKGQNQEAISIPVTAAVKEEVISTTNSNNTAVSAKPVSVAPIVSKPSVSVGAGDEIIEMDRMRKLIADHMVMSKHTSPHVTSFVEVDVTNIVLWREKTKKMFEKREGQKLTFTPIFMEAVVKAIKDFPMINVSVDGTKIIKRKNINIGMATALPSGNLIVPVIKNADGLNLIGLAKAVNELADKARTNKLSPDDIQGGTYTVTNVGTFGNVFGTPIINQPQVAILAIGAIKKKPAVIETPEGDFIGVRHFMYLSHSYDHRVVDGALGGMFVRKVADYLEQFDVNKEI
jgi:2-oxoglutarate dehydrogenase E2 component (dihydrolipoamide succinyltransferase)